MAQKLSHTTGNMPKRGFQVTLATLCAA